MQLIARDLANAYHKANTFATVEVRGGNSNTGLIEFARGSFDIALVSRNPRSDELKRPPARAVEFARDGIVLVVNSSNSLTNASREQLAKVFSGEILNWSQLSGQASQGADDAIQVVSREEGSGTRAVFEQSIMNGRRVTLTALIQSSSNDVLSYVQTNPNAIGYSAFNLWNGHSADHALSIDGVVPTLASVRSSSYPIMQTYYMVVPIDPKPELKDFIDFVLSVDGQKLVSNRMATVR